VCYQGLEQEAKMIKQKTNQKDNVAKFMKSHGRITTYEAYRKLGVTRLSAVIYNLRNEGKTVYDRFVTGKNRYGEIVSYKEYSFRKLN
jgi:hypothetical protein